MKKFKIGYYPKFELSINYNVPLELEETLKKAWNRRYGDLYERGGQDNVKEAFEEVLQAFGMPSDAISHRRYVYMAYAMALAAQPTIKHYFPEEYKIDSVQAIVSCWLKDSCEIPETWVDTLFPNINEIGRYQAADEAYNIFYGLLKTLNPKTAYNAILDILYDAITGDAISGFAAAYFLKVPSTLYSGQWEFSPLSEIE